MTFWDDMLRFHELAKKDFPDAEEGREAVRYISSLLDPVWKDELSGRHPLRTRLSMGSRETTSGLSSMPEDCTPPGKSSGSTLCSLV